MTDFRPLINDYLTQYFSDRNGAENEALLKLNKSIAYSILGEGKRYRPQLALSLAEAFQKNIERVMPFAAAVEMIHSYSLIHDDLPCMDNDDFRRGQPSNHKVFGEGFALLAGDALLTEAFYLLAEAYGDDSQLAVDLIKKLSEACGIRGMVGGQALDIFVQEAGSDENVFFKMHSMKTGALIRVAAEGSAMICGLSDQQVRLCREYGAHLGLAFQLADDLDDFEKRRELSGFPYHWGVEKTRIYYQDLLKKAEQSLSQLGIHHEI